MGKGQELYKFGNVACPEDLSAYRWTVDEPEDFELVKAVYEGFYQDKPVFDMYDVLEYIRKSSEILNLNGKFERNVGLKNHFAKTYLYEEVGV